METRPGRGMWAWEAPATLTFRSAGRRPEASIPSPYSPNPPPVILPHPSLPPATTSRRILSVPLETRASFSSRSAAKPATTSSPPRAVPLAITVAAQTRALARAMVETGVMLMAPATPAGITRARLEKPFRDAPRIVGQEPVAMVTAMPARRVREIVRRTAAAPMGTRGVTHPAPV